MKFSEFILSSKEKQDLAVKNAVIIATRINGPFQYTLLQLHSFYIEVVNHEDNHCTLNAFENTLLLEPYLEQISLPW
jgi:hypothetical protein